MPYIIILVLVIAIIIVAVRKQKFNIANAQQDQNKARDKRNTEKQNSIEVDYVEISDDE